MPTATIGRAHDKRPHSAHERDVLPRQGHRGSQRGKEGRQGLRVQHDSRVPHVHHWVRVSGGAVAPGRATPNAAAANVTNAANTAIKTSPEAFVSAGDMTRSSAKNSGGITEGVLVRVSGVGWRRICRKCVTAMGLPPLQGSGKATAWVNMYLFYSCSVRGGAGWVPGAKRAGPRESRQPHATATLKFSPKASSLLLSSG